MKVKLGAGGGLSWNGTSRRNLVSAALAIVTLAVYSQVWRHGFIRFDDPLYVTQNPRVTAGLTLDGIGWALTSGHTANWHPLTWLSHMLDAELFGLRPGPHHATSVVLHAANAVLLFLVLRRMTGALWRSTLVAALFALHPLHVESVAWVSERKDVLSTFFFLLTLGAYARYVSDRSLAFYLLSLLSFAAGLLSKPMLVTTPFLLLLLDYWPLGRWSVGPAGTASSRGKAAARETRALRGGAASLIPEKLPFLALALLSSGVTLSVQRKGGAVSSFEAIPLPLRIENALVTYAEYLRKMIWPADLSVFYPHPREIAWWAVIVSALLLAGITALVLYLGKLRPYLPVGWFWYVGTLVPVIGLIQVGSQAMADRYTYIPLVGVFVAIAWSIPDLRHRRSAASGVATTAGLALVAASSAATWSYLSVWKDSRTLFEHATRVTTGNDLAYALLGQESAQAGNLSRAVELYGSALAVNPRSNLARNNLGIALAQQGKIASAIEELSSAAAIDTRGASASYNLGLIYAKQGKETLAIQHFTEALRRQPDYADAHIDLALVLERIHRAGEAIRHYQDVLRDEPGHPEAHLRLGMLLARLRRAPEAVASYRKALEARPDRVEALNNLAWLLATSGDPKVRDGKEAVELAERAARLVAGRNVEVLDTLSAAYAEAGRFDDAIQTSRKAIQLALSSGQRDLADGFEKHLQVFLGGQPLREPPPAASATGEKP